MTQLRDNENAVIFSEDGSFKLLLSKDTETDDGNTNASQGAILASAIAAYYSNPDHINEILTWFENLEV